MTVRLTSSWYFLDNANRPNHNKDAIHPSSENIRAAIYLTPHLEALGVKESCKYINETLILFSIAT